MARRRSPKITLPWKQLLGVRRGRIGALLATLLLRRKLLGSRRGGCGIIIAVILVVLVGFLIDSVNSDKPLSSKTKAPFEEGIWTVVYVVDGDTIDVAESAEDGSDKNKKHRIRFIGMDTPETKKPNTPVEPYGPEASEFTKRKIAEANNMVRLAFDGDQVDRYNRSLAMVYLQMPDGNEIWLNELLVREGLARAQLQYRFSKGAKEKLRQAEEEAKAAKRNIWSLPL
jgi:micrococcal nuclease